MAAPGVPSSPGRHPLSHAGAEGKACQVSLPACGSGNGGAAANASEIPRPAWQSLTNEMDDLMRRVYQRGFADGKARTMAASSAVTEEFVNRAYHKGKCDGEVAAAATFAATAAMAKAAALPTSTCRCRTRSPPGLGLPVRPDS
jgi:hypothetical protein